MKEQYKRYIKYIGIYSGIFGIAYLFQLLYVENILPFNPILGAFAYIVTWIIWNRSKLK